MFYYVLIFSLSKYWFVVSTFRYTCSEFNYAKAQIALMLNKIGWIVFYAVSAIFQPCNGGDY